MWKATGAVVPSPTIYGTGPTLPLPDPEKPPAKPRPNRFFATVDIDPDKARFEVARIMDGLLVELTRTKGSELRVTLELEGTSAEEGYPEDVVEIVKASARDLKLSEESFGFEE